VLTAPLAIVANALTCLGSAFFLMFIKGQARATQPTERLVLRREIPEGIRFVFGHPQIRPLLLCATLAAGTSVLIHRRTGIIASASTGLCIGIAVLVFSGRAIALVAL
jgi:hypothetical protein